MLSAGADLGVGPSWYMRYVC